MTGAPDSSRSPSGGQRRYSNPPVSNGSMATTRSLDELIEESIVASEENQRRKIRQTQAAAALLIAFTALASFGVGVYSLLSAPAPEQDVDVEPAYPHHVHNTSSISTTLRASKIFNDLQQEQIQNYRDGKALIISVHITHHAGTTFCSEMKKWGEVPEFACLGGNNYEKTGLPPKNDRPWSNDETAERTDLVRKYFHMISWEFGRIPEPPLGDTNWEYGNLVSVYITRNPLDRLLSGGGVVNRKYGTLEERTLNQWWAYSNSTYTDNFALQRLTAGTCVDGDRTPESCVDKGKELLSRFTFVLDQECLSESMAAFAEIMGKPIPDGTSRTYNKIPKSATETARERIKSDDIYKYLVERNKMDTALYEWSKSISLVRCDKLVD
jgi:hypothetical protein